MKKIILFTIVLSSLCLPAAAEMRVSDAVVTTDVVERNPIDSIQNYPSGVERLYCYTHVLGGGEEASVTHVWYLEDAEMARIDLPVRSSSWRTWSSKSILPGWKGDWRVEILDPQGDLLGTVNFTLF